MKNRYLWIGIVALILILLAGAYFAYGSGNLNALFPGQPPTVQLLHPDGAQAVYSGDGLAIQAQAIGEGGIARLDLRVDGVVLDSRVPANADQVSFVTLFNWFASIIGGHSIEVIAYDQQGQASEPAQVEITVHPRGPVARNGQPDNLPPGSDVTIVEQNLPNAAEEAAGDNGAGGAGGDDNDGDAGGNGAQGEQDFQVPPDVLDDQAPDAPGDSAPDVEFFDYDLDFVDPDFEAVIQVRAVDDLGVARLDFVFSNDNAAQQSFSHDCGGQAVCEIGTRAALAPGEWLLSVQAVDNSGQASEPALLIAEVLGGDDQPPAAAEHDEGWRDWFADQFGDIGAPDFDLNWDFRQPSFDLAAWLEAMAGDDEPEEQGSINAHCIQVSGGRAEDRNVVSFEITCPELVASEGHIAYANVEKRLPYQQDGGIALHIRDWHDENRQRFVLGDSLSWDDFDVVCGMQYEYAVRISEARVVDPGRNSMTALALGETLAYASIPIEAQACNSDDLGDVNLNAQLTEENAMEISWQLPADADWPQDPPIDNGVRIQLLRYAPFLDEEVTVFDQIATVEQINAQPDYLVTDPDVACNSSYWYTLQVISADADLDLVSPGWLIRRPVEAPSFACQQAPLDDWFDVSTFWYNDTYHRALVEVEIPPDAAFPEGERVEVWLEHYREGTGRCSSPPCDGNYKVFHANWLVNGRLQNATYEDFFDLACGGQDYLIRMAIAVDRVGVEYSNSVRVSSVKCPPPTPTILSAYATSNDCPGAVERCVQIEWEPYRQPQDLEHYLPAVQLVVQRRNLNHVEYQDFAFDVDATGWIDTDPLIFNPNAIPALQCEVPLTYRLAAYDENGRFSGASPIQLFDLTCDGAWDLFVERR